MTRIPMSAAAAGLLRALLARAGGPRDRILLTESRSVEWQSLTFVGERHVISLRLVGPKAGDTLNRLTEGLADAEFAIPGQIVADIALASPPRDEDGGVIIVELEALTVAE
jgi:hypothetical protein